VVTHPSTNRGRYNLTSVNESLNKHWSPPHTLFHLVSPGTTRKTSIRSRVWIGVRVVVEFGVKVDIWLSVKFEVVVTVRVTQLVLMLGQSWGQFWGWG